ncbi:hypothetical protein OIU79_010095, partial [Salix purpurea]
MNSEVFFFFFQFSLSFFPIIFCVCLYILKSKQKFSLVFKKFIYIYWVSL